MLSFMFVQHHYTQDPSYHILRNGYYIGTIEYDGTSWAVQNINRPYLLNHVHFMQIANKLTETNDSLRAQRWFK